MIYILMSENNSEILGLIEGPAGLAIAEEFEKFKVEWSNGLDWSIEEWNRLQEAEGYDVARAYLQRYRDGYDEKIEKLGTPLKAFTKTYKKIDYVIVDIQED